MNCEELEIELCSHCISNKSFCSSNSIYSYLSVVKELEIKYYFLFLTKNTSERYMNAVRVIVDKCFPQYKDLLEKIIILK
jgi:hypothetical protein